MTIKVETYDFNLVVACLWKVGDKQWEGIINNEFNAGDLNIIKTEKAILLFRKDPAGPVQPSSGSSLAAHL